MLSKRSFSIRAAAPLALALAAAAFWPSPAVQAQGKNPQFIPPTPQQKELARAQARRRPASETPSEQVLVYLTPGTDPNAFARRYRVQLVQGLQSDPDAYVFAAPSVQIAQMVAASAQRDPSVRKAMNNSLMDLRLHTFVLNDPLFRLENPSIRRPWQWHLQNFAQPERDLLVVGAWRRGVTGTGVTIGIIDDGFDIGHPDLVENYSAADSFDFAQNDNDPSPVSVFDNHGTPVAGLAAARGGNGIGLLGSAPFAKWAGLRLNFQAAIPVAHIIDANRRRSDTPGAPIQVKNHSYGFDGTYITNTFEADAQALSAAVGTLHVRSAGNNRGFYTQDSNKFQPQNDENSITVAAMGSNGVFSSYSSFGANVFCTAPSDSFFPYTFGILAPDRRGAAGYNTGVFDLQNYDIFPDPDYTSIFGGTSASAPLIAGVMALAKQANPNMNVRFAKHLLAMTSRVIHANDTTDTSDGGWKTNAAGYRFNQNYGFGLVHADRFAWEAGNWQGVTDLVTHTTGTVTFSPAINIPDADQNGNPGQVIRTFNVPNTQTTPLEVVKVRLEMTHTYRGDLEVYLTSPSGTTSRLFSRAAADADAMVTWTFITNAFWGERPAGTWTIRVLDTARLDTGTWRSYRVDMNLGRLFSVPLATQLVPANAAENGPDTPLTVNGRFFTPVSVITWNGAPLPTTFISSTQLRTTIPGSSLTPAGIAQVGVVTPAPGGTSAPLRFWIGPFLAVSFVSGPTRHPVTRNVTATIRVTNTGDRPMSNVVVPKVYFWRDNELAARHSNENNIVLGDLAVGASKDFAISYNNVSIAEGQRCRFRFDTTFTGGKQDQTLIFYMPR